MKLAPALVPLEAWFWYMLFLDLLSAKPCLGFLIELIEQILRTIKVIASKLTNEVRFERRKIYLSTDYNIMIMQQLHN
jgi:hypothetical protein